MIDTAQADARKTAPSSKQAQDATFNRHQQRAAALRAELEQNPQALTGDAKP
jgi:hypothetical protein